jgi:thymidylate synthase
MQYINARNVSEALYLAVQALETTGVEVETRNGKALEFPYPVMTSYSHSRERVLFYQMRDANPYFHLMESFWMLAGKNEVDWISNYNGRMSSYSDDGVTINGAYGYRWKHWFGKDQLEIAVHRLLNYENDRRTVVSMWDPIKDFSKENTGKDHPCNTQIMFWVRNNTLNMTVCNRSNDMIWGAYGANAVHMSVLLEYMAARIDCAVGTYYQFSNNLHAYVDTLEKVKNIEPDYDPYLTISINKKEGFSEKGSYNPKPLIDEPACFDKELQCWMNNETNTFANSYFDQVLTPMDLSWNSWKAKNIDEAVRHAENIEDLAWRKACVEWLMRRW